MEGKRRKVPRRLQRVHAAGRGEEQLWALAYEILWAQPRRSLTGRTTRPDSASVSLTVALARRA